jgi:hypothetical protein
MDIKGRGKVIFIEFGAFMSSCGEEKSTSLQKRRRRQGYSRDEKLYAASRRKFDGGGGSRKIHLLVIAHPQRVKISNGSLVLKPKHR